MYVQFTSCVQGVIFSLFLSKSSQSAVLRYSENIRLSLGREKKKKLLWKSSPLIAFLSNSKTIIVTFLIFFFFFLTFSKYTLVIIVQVSVCLLDLFNLLSTHALSCFFFKFSLPISLLHNLTQIRNHHWDWRET